MTDVYEQNWFKKLLSLVGSKIEVMTMDGRKLSGDVRFASFDCFLLNAESGVEVIRYGNIQYLTPLHFEQNPNQA